MKKKLICFLLALTCIMSSTASFAATMYAPDGREINVSDADVPVWQSVGWYTTPVIKMYALGGKEAVIYKDQCDAWIAVGWHTEPVMKVYAPGGKEAVIYKSKLDSWKAVGWYETPVVNMYSPNGTEIVVDKSSKDSWKAVGWFEYPVLTVYSPSGSAIVIDKTTLPEWINAGWFQKPDANEEDIVYVGGRPYYLGMSVSELPAPDCKLYSVEGYMWYVYGTQTYDNFVALAVNDNKVVSLAAAGPGFNYGGYRAGDQVDPSKEKFNKNVMTDSNDNMIIHTVYLETYKYKNSRVVSDETLDGESRLNFHLVNAFRRYHGLSILEWSDPAAKAAALHSQDMANRGFYDHYNPDGESPGARMKKQGVGYGSWSENIVAGRKNAVYAHDAWINSKGHRSNMLGQYRPYLGVGMGVGGSSSYGLYYTQNYHN